MKLYLQGRSQRDIADILLIDTKTVGNIVAVIMRLEMSKTLLL